ncbi:MAG TPA: EAL domain-containing protein [Steroidobacteraceae bacterium]|nr:EAL domain-containing protein [Steroidobacteraceae bacterium]
MSTESPAAKYEPHGNLPLKVLVIEDSESDAFFAMNTLQKAGFNTTHRCVQTAAELKAALKNECWDAVISDFHLPKLDGMEALRIFRSSGLDIPFMLLSGTIGEELAVEAVKAGASDYIMKDSLTRLAPALKRELKEAQARTAHRKSQSDLIDSEERFRSLTALSSDWYWEQDETMHLIFVSAGLKSSYREALESWAEKTRLEFPCLTLEGTKQSPTTDKMPFRDLELQPFMRDGNMVYLSISGEPKFAGDGHFVGYRGVGRDISKRKESEQKLQRLNRLYTVLSSINSLVMRVRDRDELFRSACRLVVDDGEFNKAWIGIVDPSENQIVPVAWVGADEDFMTSIRAVLSSREGALLGNSRSARAIREKTAIVSNNVGSDPGLVLGRQHLKSGVQSFAILPLIVSDKAIGVLALYANEPQYFDGEGLELLTELAGNIAFALDHIDKQERLNYLAYYDELTGLANRGLFLDRVAQYMRSAVSGGHQLALFMIDLERFKNINDSLGRPAGDALLLQVAEWLTQTAGDANLLARVDADHFALVVPKMRQESDAARILEKTIGSFMNHAFVLNGTVYRIAAKVGVVVFPDDGVDADTLFKNAEVALKKAKVCGDRYLFYAEKMTQSVVGSLGLENRLRHALEREEFVLHYQPKVNIESGLLTGAEALIRWNDPQSGLVPPSRFIRLLEETGLIHEVGRWALHQAIAEYLRWRNAGLPAVRIAVNVSPLQLRNRDFVAEIAQAIGVAPGAGAGLELEITESLIMEDVNHSIASLQAIREMGVNIAIDDFGTGFSSLSYLSKLPVDTLKIDRSFVIELEAGTDGRTLVSVIINLGHALKLKVVAEGVETDDQLRQLRMLSCDEMQGFLFGKAEPSAIFENKYLIRSAHATGN